MDDLSASHIDGTSSGDLFSSSATSSFDVNLDGYDDLLVGAPGTDTAGSDTGAVYLLAGSECVDYDADGFSYCTDCDDGDPNLNRRDEDTDGYSTCDGDCNDYIPTVYPGAPEACDALDNDCDGSIPPDEIDTDEDGFLACVDCDDDAPETYPDAVETCDGEDNNCDGALPVWDDPIPRSHAAAHRYPA